MKSLTELEAIRKKTLEDISMKNNEDGRRIVVGMATCGIAAGAKPVMNTFVDELKKKNMNVPVVMTGCIGVCRLEPIAEVINSDGSRATYVNMTSEKVKKVVAEHIVNGNVCTEYTIGAVK